MNIVRRFAGYLKPHTGHIAATLISTVLFVVFSSAAYWLAASFLTALFSGGIQSPESADSINDILNYWTARLLLGDSASQTLLRAAIAIVVAFLGKNLFGYLQLWYVSFVEQRVIKEIRDELMEHLMRQDLSFFQTERRGHLISTMLNDVEQLNLALNKSFTKLIRDPLNAIVLLVLLFAVSWKLTLAALVVVPAVGWTVQVLARRIKGHASNVQELLARLTGQLQETLSGMRIVKAFTNEPFEIHRFKGYTTGHYRSALKQERLRRLVIPLNEIVGVVIICAILYGGGELVLVRKSFASEDFVRFLVLLFALLNPLLSLTNLMANIRVAEASGERVFRLLDTVPRLPKSNRPLSAREMTAGFRFEDVGFRYAPDAPDVLDSISLDIRTGEKLAIVGRSGSGKTTLINLLPRFMDPTRGRILLDGNDLRDLDLHQLRSLFGIVTQEVILFHDSIAENIAYGLADVNPRQIVAAAKAAQADDFIRALPQGYDTLVGEQGSLFSGGQRQRISIARALLRNPHIVILDEATSALDSESEDAVSTALETLTEGRTVVIVTHRIASVRNADRIVVIERGQIVDIGTHRQLLRRCTLYKELASHQQLAEPVEAEA
ncbi:MAG: ABC transporter ATP-binding protein [bacterium]